MKKTIFILTLLLPVCFLFAQNNVSLIQQYGNGSDVKVTQEGDLNYSNVYTDGDRNAMSFVSQEGAGINDSEVGQYGNGNTVDVSQQNLYTKLYDENTSDIYQNGNRNSASVDQVIVVTRAFPLGGKLNADVDQNGDGNTADVGQEGLWNNARINQLGNRGIANQYQGTSKFYDGHAYISDARIRQGPRVDEFSRAQQDQVGYQNDAFIIQNSRRGSVALQVQINDVEAVMGHRGIDVNQAFIEQRGGNNEAYQLQYYTVRAMPNDANVYQRGMGNFSQEVQIGGDNYSDIVQMGDRNKSKVLQRANGVSDPATTGLPFSY